MQKPVVVVGAGLSGLVCARRLEQAGREVLVLESSDGVGGRMRTDVVEGFHLDRGFQVFFEAYPNAKLELDLGKLNLKDFEPGCLVFDGRKMREVHRENWIETVFAKWVAMPDLMRMHQLGDELDDLTEEEVWHLEDVPMIEFLKTRKFTDKAIDRFFRPFFGGVFLDRDLNVSSRLFAFVWQMLDRAPATTPAKGIQAIPEQIAEGIKPESIRFRARVESLIRKDSRVCGVRLESGEEIEADLVVVATDQASCSRLTGVGTPQESKGCTTIHFAATERPVFESILMVNGSGVGQVNHVACMTNASKELAPNGQYLISATLLDSPKMPDMVLAESVRYELKDWFPDQQVTAWVPLRVDRIHNAQLVQSDGFQDRLTPSEPEAGLIIAGDHTTYAGIDGAVVSGQRAAAIVLNANRELVGA
jgi:phytoene dehydrogenase-like protein